jgi:hypothetical protein
MPSLLADAFRATLELFDSGLALMRQNLRRQFPDAAEAEIDQRLERWLRVRPGAEARDRDEPRYNHEEEAERAEHL